VRENEMARFVAALPKAELHLHLVGSASPDTVLALARRHPDGGVPTEPDALAEFYRFTGFTHFLQTYSKVNLLVRTGADVVTLLDGMARELAASGVQWAEVQVTVVRNRMAGISYDDLAQALADGRQLAAGRYGVGLGWIFDADCALGPAGAAETLDFAMRYRPPGTVGLGLAGPEDAVIHAEYAPFFAVARDAGLHSVPHAGETVGPAAVWAAVNELGAERIGHGIGAAADPGLLDVLASRGIALDVCLVSNVRTGAVPSLAEHPLPALISAGVPVTLSTDDPGMFATGLNGEYLKAHEQFGLGKTALANLARTSARAAFCPEDIRAEMLAGIEAATAQGS
jgi:aminodeoxyfutalosine deaminase